MNLLFYLALGGAILILIYGGIHIRRRFPRLEPPPEDPYSMAVAERAWKSGNVIVGTVDENGVLHMSEIPKSASEHLEKR